ncbi:serine protease inhibitor ecotin [Ectopseudomonas mendocina]|uniref:Serine protease inhibitor ecotin n=1 Tax=Ectopseudomonas mendocina TaxID=300 RepID=A0ABZ2RDL8_ECTME
MYEFNKVFASLICTLPLMACAATPEALKPYPAPTEGYTRHVIDLPKLDNENDHKVELLAGKTMEVDCNIHRLGGQWQDKTAEGWGYSYYELSDVGPGISTMMGCPNNEPKKAFVPAGGEAKLVRYNSKLPIVVYTPADVEVRYRVWSATPEATVAKQQ